MYKNFGKRFIDVIIAAAGIIILSPLFLFLALLIYFSDFKNPFFFQPRPGLNGKCFTIIKFRTMNNRCDDNHNLLPDSQRLTVSGKFLRRNSLDELPQLWNVLAGEMSLIGPRPLLMEYLPLYTKRQSKRHIAKPGITGWAQVNGRDNISWEEKFDCDLWYVDHLSFQTDLTILILTARTLFPTKPGHKAQPDLIEKFTG